MQGINCLRSNLTDVYLLERVILLDAFKTSKVRYYSPYLPSKPQRGNPCQRPSSGFQMEDSLQQYQQFDLNRWSRKLEEESNEEKLVTKWTSNVWWKFNIKVKLKIKLFFLRWFHINILQIKCSEVVNSHTVRDSQLN